MSVFEKKFTTDLSSARYFSFMTTDTSKEDLNKYYMDRLVEIINKSQ